MTTETPDLPYAHAIRLDGAMSPGELEFLYETACSMPENARVVEIGSFKGRSSVAICEGLSGVRGARFVAIDPWRRKNILTTELFDPGDPDEDHVYNRFLRNTGAYDFVEAMRTTSLEAVKEFDDESVDWVFIDGDHRFEAVRADILSWFPKVRHGGLISGHDYTWFDVRCAVAGHLGPVGLRESIWHVRKTESQPLKRALPLLAGVVHRGLRRVRVLDRPMRAVSRALRR
jgi:predicted O-methyltransferase YrrM